MDKLKFTDLSPVNWIFGKIQDFPTDDYDLKKMVSGQPDVEKFSLVRVNDITHSFIALYRDLHTG